MTEKRGRGRPPNPPGHPKDIKPFVQAIHAAADDLDFALRMLYAEMEAQGFTPEEIAAEQRETFRQVADKIIRDHARN